MADFTQNNQQSEAEFLGVLLPWGYDIEKTVAGGYLGNPPPNSLNFIIYDSTGIQSAEDPEDWFHFIIPPGVSKISMFLDATLEEDEEYIVYSAGLYGPSASLISASPSDIGMEASGIYAEMDFGFELTPYGIRTVWSVTSGDYYVSVTTGSTTSHERSYRLHIDLNEHLTNQPDHTAEPTPPTFSLGLTLGFDADYYLQNNPDVLNAVTSGQLESAEQHFRLYGWQEGRDPNAVFDTSDYLALNPDVAAANINPLDHYLNFGLNEGRAPSAAFVAANKFDWSTYIDANPDLVAAGIDTASEAYAHYVSYGAFEERPGVQTTGGVPIGDNGLPDWA